MTLIADREAFVRDQLAVETDERLAARREAEAQAVDLLDRKAGEMTEGDFRDLFSYFNGDFGNGRRTAVRFSPAFVGAGANLLVADIGRLNGWTARIWRGSPDEALAAVGEIYENPRELPGAGRTYPSILMYLRDRPRWAYWTDITERGLRNLEPSYEGSRGRPTAEAFDAFSQAVARFREAVGLPPELVDYVLAAAGRVTDAESERPEPRWEQFSFWASRLYAVDYFDAEERDYKLVVAERVKRVRELLETGGDWRKGFPDVFRAPNNLVNHFVHNPFQEAVRERPDEVEAMLRVLWSEAPVEDALERALELWPSDNSPGNQLVLASVFLMGVDATRYPVFRSRVVEQAHKLLEFPPPPSSSAIDLARQYAPEDLAVRLGVSAKTIRAFLREEFPRETNERRTSWWPLGDELVQAVVDRFGRANADAPAVTARRYFAFLELLDLFESQLGLRGLQIRDRLDAQSLVWWLTSAGPPEEWPEEEKQAFLRYQRGEPPVVEPEADPTAATAAVVRIASPTAELASRLLLTVDWLSEITSLLNEKQQVVFYGPPGTGKTFIAQELAKHATAAGGAWELVQFHPAYTYEDFFEGYRPHGAGGQLTYTLQPGPLRRIAAAAADKPDEPYILVIDEINRGNLPKVFGELYFLLEYRDRPIRLQYSPDEEFRLPENLFLIGTMNTADRSIALVDSALRRRFYFFPFMPTRDPLDGVLAKWLAARGHPEEPAQLLAELNATLGAEPGAGDEFAIGPSYLMPRDGSNPRIDHAWRYAIAPLLEERFYGALSPEEIERRFSPDALRAARAQAADADDEAPLADEP